MNKQKKCNKWNIASSWLSIIVLLLCQCVGATQPVKNTEKLTGLLALLVSTPKQVVQAFTTTGISTEDHASSSNTNSTETVATPDSNSSLNDSIQISINGIPSNVQKSNIIWLPPKENTDEPLEFIIPDPLKNASLKVKIRSMNTTNGNFNFTSRKFTSDEITNQVTEFRNSNFINYQKNNDSYSIQNECSGIMKIEPDKNQFLMSISLNDCKLYPINDETNENKALAFNVQFDFLVKPDQDLLNKSKLKYGNYNIAKSSNTRGWWLGMVWRDWVRLWIAVTYPPVCNNTYQYSNAPVNCRNTNNQTICQRCDIYKDCNGKFSEFCSNLPAFSIIQPICLNELLHTNAPTNCSITNNTQTCQTCDTFKDCNGNVTEKCTNLASTPIGGNPGETILENGILYSIIGSQYCSQCPSHGPQTREGVIKCKPSLAQPLECITHPQWDTANLNCICKK